MSQPVVVYWAPAVGNEAAIASLQTLAGAGSLTLNSNQPNSPVSVNGPYVYDKVIRTVSLTSADETSPSIFTITGLGSAVDGSGNPTGPFAATTEDVPGPDMDTVYSTKIWKRIDSITVDSAVTNVSAGFGSTGITEYIFMDYNKIDWHAACQMQLLTSGGGVLTYTVYQSLTKPETPNPAGYLDPWPAIIPGFAVAAGVTAATTNQIVQLPFPVTIVWARIADNALAADSAYFTVLQQGIRS